MSTNIIDFSNINYAYKTHSFFSIEKEEDKTLTSTDDNPIKIEDLLSKYKEIFGEKSVSDYLKTEDSKRDYLSSYDDKSTALKLFSGIRNDLKKIFCLIHETDNLNLDFIINGTISDVERKNLTENFYTLAKTINGKSIDSNCLEGYRAYSFYLEKIILLLKKLNNAIERGQNAINEIKALDPQYMSANQTVEEYVNSKIHELSAELYMADKDIADVTLEFKSCLKYNTNTKSWETAHDFVEQLPFYRSIEIGSYGPYGPDYGRLYWPNNGENIKLNDLRELEVKVTSNEEEYHKIACFGELNLLDKLRYIRYYYETILRDYDSNYQVFPDDSETGYPCIPDKQSTTDTKATENIGAFELFYVGYLVDRDGSIDAYSSCLEAKSTALTNNIGLQSEHIEAYNQYLAFINRATQLLNESQSGGTNNIAHGAHLGLTYFCGGTMRDLLEIDGVNYIVLSCTGKDGSMDDDNNPGNFNYGYNDRYLLVRADEKGLKALYNTKTMKDPNDSNKELEVITAGDLEGVFKKKDGFKFDCEYKPSSGFEGTKFYKRALSGDSTWPVVFSSGSDNEILIWDCPREHAEKYLPKQLIIQEIEPGSVAQYDNYSNHNAWGDNAEAKNRVINSWTTAFSNKSEYINTAIEIINTDITSLRSKMDTMDSLCSTLRNRSFETKKTLISNLRS